MERMEDVMRVAASRLMKVVNATAFERILVENNSGGIS
eukprot:CAMPEP_0202470660 /NCGR_PEP_ID=MMETSP1360-20130828/82297_1 /ASSEMBLY_ACC=CAM_ASM_000848 /TAXON_ID=515479 /ORGANISM="Licmophora paradoxa, Strain CCMP2313" /LENGTH=37 /DNA_ID= /DNA_START= /DNA_END= /DNA_ORIENTATION=